MSKIRRYQIWISLVTSVLLLITGITGAYLGLSSNGTAQGFDRGQGFSSGSGNGMPSNGFGPGNFNQGDSSDNSSADSDQNNSGTFSDGSSSDDGNSAGTSDGTNMRPNGNFAGGFPGQEAGNNKVLQVLRGSYNGTDIRWLIDVISGLIILIALAGGFTAIQTLRLEKQSKEEIKA